MCRGTCHAALDGVQLQTATAGSRAGANILLEQAGIRIAAECRASAQVGGDFYFVLPRRAGRVAVVIGDVCGRGEDGAGFLQLVSPTIDALVRAALPPARLLSEIDRRLRDVLPLDRFVTLSIVEIDTHATELTVANAGHVPAMVRSDHDVRLIGRASGPPLGLALGSYSQECEVLVPGDVLVLMSDGLLEAVETDLIRMSALRSLLSRAPDGANAIHRTLLSSLDATVCPRRPDDVTLLVVEVLGKRGARKVSRPKQVGCSCAASP